MTDILEALRRSLASIAAVVGLVVLWQLMAMAFNVPNWLLPAPTAIWAEFWKQAHLLGKCGARCQDRRGRELAG